MKRKYCEKKFLTPNNRRKQNRAANHVCTATVRNKTENKSRKIL